MKRYAAIVFVLLLLLSEIISISTALAKTPRRPSPTPIPSAPPKVPEGWVCRSRQTDLELRDWINGIMTQSSKAQVELKLAHASNAITQKQLDDSIQAGKDLASECAADKICAKAPLSCWFHRLMRHLFWIAGAVVLLVIGLLVASFFSPALAPIIQFFVSSWQWILSWFKPKPPAS